MAGGGVLKYKSDIDEFYKNRGGEPVWVDGNELNTSGKELLGILKQSWMNGLNPNSYHVSRIIDAQSPIERELLLTDGYIHYVRDLSGMRVNASDMGLNAAHWRQPIDASEALSLLLKHKNNIAEFLLLREPQTRTYQRLKSELTTLRELDKVKQIIVNMERLRWIEDVKPERFVVVNIPSATLWAIDKGRVTFEMPVIVGRKTRPTASFVTSIHGVRFNPTWTIPPTIKLKDILPKLKENPQYLSDKGIELYDGFAHNAPTLDPSVIDWNNIDKKALHSLRMVQIPGKHNPLGNIRFLMPNKHNIYLHDTNNKELFSRADRAISSGCVRLQDSRKMAVFALEKRKDWNKNAIDEILNKGKTTEVYSSEKIDIYLLYYTVWLGGKNQVIYGFDIYNNDKILLQLLENLDEFPIIRDNGDKIVHVVD